MRGGIVVEEKNRQKKARPVETEELEQVSGGSAWMDDSEAMDGIRKGEDASPGGIVTGTDGKTSPVFGAGLLDEMALGLDRVREKMTSIAVRK